MKILFDYPEPALLIHGGMQVQIAQTKVALEALGCGVEYLRWWDEQQRGDILHYFGRLPPDYIIRAREKGIKVVLAALRGEQCSRAAWQLRLQRHAIRLAKRFLPQMVTRPFRWDAYRLADATIALTPCEAHLVNYVFDAPREKIHLVPNGVESVFFESQPMARGPWLVCTAIVTERKQVVELAEAAIRAQTPVWIIGKPYSDSDAYGQRFLAFAKAHPQIIRYEGSIKDRTQLAQVYRQARGFVLLSTWESLSLSALEAAACECPLLLSDLPWARDAFQDKASYCPVGRSPAHTAAVLRQFYDAAPRLPLPPRPLSWAEIGKHLQKLYASLLSKA